jgi:nucleoside-diphosphate-sugar epimerase
MKVLLTGASSFTGYWFVRELALAGHEVVAVFRRRPEQIADEIRRERVKLTLRNCRAIFGCDFGDAAFLDLVRAERWDLFCHHAAEVTDYKSPDFDPIAALAGNTRGIESVLKSLIEGRSRPRLLLTGSVFENDEGAGSGGLQAFSPYGLSKSLTWQMFRYHAARAGFALGKFVIPNPFGPYEGARFTAYLMTSWLAERKATVSSPAYVRDNIHVSLLAKVYAKFAAELPDRPGLSRINPSGYPESQGAFTQRFAAAMRERLKLSCEVEMCAQTTFAEPRVRINTDLPDVSALAWDEGRAWDGIAAFYSEKSPT